MANLFNSSGGDGSSGGDNFSLFNNEAPLFKNEEQAEGSLFGDNSSFFGSAFSKPGDGTTEAEPTFLAPFSRTPPRKRQNQGPPASQSALQLPAAGEAMFEGSNTAPGNNLSSSMDLSNIAPGQLLERSAPFQLGQTCDGSSSSLASHAPPNTPTCAKAAISVKVSSRLQQNSSTQFKCDAEGQEMRSEMEFQSGYSAQQHGPGIGFSVQTSSVKEDEESARGQLGGKVVAYDQSGHQAGEGQGLLHQLLVGKSNISLYWFLQDLTHTVLV